MVFVVAVLEEDLDVVAMARLGVGIPFLDNMNKMFQQGVLVDWQSFIMDIEEEKLARHRHWAAIRADFLCKWLGVVEVEGLQWYREFANLVELMSFYDEDD